MPIINNLVHEPEIKSITKKEQVIELLKEVKSSIGRYLNIVNLTNPKESLKDILKIIEKGEYEGRRNTTVDLEQDPIYRVDLSKAKEIIDDYRARSERRCEYCGNLGTVYKDMKPGRYCKIGETEKSIVELPTLNNESPKIHEFWKAGCNDRTPTLKPLEELLEEQN
ncbi:MAG: hypothetical protein NTZ83_04235 [Candidatus Pacearchaeota archaeon]|nr:hypothetical protein [Candidatus Pacearchaeota archaeon]